VQYPSAGVFTYKDLTWLRAEEADAGDDCFSIDLERIPKTPKMKASKQVALIPWERVQDFREGEQRGRKDVETKFVRTKNDPRNVRDIKAFRWNVYIEYERYCFTETLCLLVYYANTVGIEFGRACHSLVKRFLVGGNASTDPQIGRTQSGECPQTWSRRPRNTTRRGSASLQGGVRRALVRWTHRKVAPLSGVVSACST
jgi:hypothetical protein